MPTQVGPLNVAQAWLRKHSTSAHTKRKYEAQFQQFCEWLFLGEQDLLSVEPSDLEKYFIQLAQGTLQSSEDVPPQARSPRTVQLSRSVLRSFFRELVASGLRASNPMDFMAPPVIQSTATAITKSVESSNDWIFRRQRFVDAAASQRDSVAKLRALVVAEVAYWLGLRRSEIARAAMADFLARDTGWVMKVRRFGSGDTDLIEVPDHVMRVVVEYRLARDLEADPKTSEHDVPLIARLKSEKFVNPWTVANSLLLLEDNANDFSTKMRRQSIVLLRRELIQRSLEASISGRKLSRHLRSAYAVQQVERTLPGDSLVADLERLAA
jgi:site-specific recombinase XerD